MKKKINNKTDLQFEIEKLKEAQRTQGQNLKDSLVGAYGSLKPSNLIKGAVENLSSDPAFTESVVGGLFGTAGGYFTRKIISGKSKNIFRNMLGALMQMGITNIISSHPHKIKTFGKYIYHFISNKANNSSRK